MAIEIVDFPMKHGDFPSFFACLPGRVICKGIMFKRIEKNQIAIGQQTQHFVNSDGSIFFVSRLAKRDALHLGDRNTGLSWIRNDDNLGI